MAKTLIDGVMKVFQGVSVRHGGQKLSQEQRKRLEERRDELAAELKWIEVALRTDDRMRLGEKLRAEPSARQSPIERGGWRNGRWRSDGEVSGAAPARGAAVTPVAALPPSEIDKGNQ